MNTPEKRNRDWWDERVEAFIDGALEGTEDVQIRELLDVDEPLAEEIYVARTIQHGFRSMASTTCPEIVSKDIMRIISRTKRAEKLEYVRELIRTSMAGYRRYALVVTIVVAVVVGVSLQREGTPPEADVAQALADVKWTMALVSGVSTDAAKVVRSDVFEPLVRDNIGRTLEVFGESQN